MKMAVPLATAIALIGILGSLVMGMPFLIGAIVFVVITLVVGFLTDLGLFD